jgi:exodeoxyribonuclease VII large subunit
VDVSLADMVADVRAATPSNAAQILVPDKSEVIRAVRRQVQSLLPRTEQAIDGKLLVVRSRLGDAISLIDRRYSRQQDQLDNLRRVLAELDPRKVLARGYALIRGEIEAGKIIEIEKSDIVIAAEVKHVSKK